MNERSKLMLILPLRVRMQLHVRNTRKVDYEHLLYWHTVRVYTSMYFLPCFSCKYTPILYTRAMSAGWYNECTPY